MRTIWVAALVLVACTTAHETGTDGGADTSDANGGTDAAPGEDTSRTDAAATPLCRAPSRVGTLVEVGDGYTLRDGPFAIRGTYAYRLSADAIEPIDISTPGAPRAAGYVTTMARGGADVAIVGDVLLAAGAVIEAFDLSTATAPRSIGTSDVGGRVTAMVIDAPLGIAAISRTDGSSALVKLDASNPRALHVAGALELGAGSVGTVVLDGTTAFALWNPTDAFGTLLVSADASGATPRMLDMLPVDVGLQTRLARHGTALYANSDFGRLVTFDVHDPTAMTLVGETDVTNHVPGVAVAGDLLLVSHPWIDLFDLSLPGLAPLGTIDMGSQVIWHAELVGNELVMSGVNGLITVGLDCR